MSLGAGELRHRVTIKQLVSEQDSDGDTVKTWIDFAVDVPAAIDPLSARDLLAAKAADSSVVARIKIRARSGLKASMRVLHGEKVYQPLGWLPDKDSGLEYVTAPCELLESMEP